MKKGPDGPFVLPICACLDLDRQACAEILLPLVPCHKTKL